MISVILKIEDDKYREAFSRAIYFLNSDGIIYYLWDDNTDYKLPHYKTYILITDGINDEFEQCFFASHHLQEPYMHRSDSLDIEKGMSLDVITQKIIHRYGRGLGQIAYRAGKKIHIVTGSTGGCGKKLFAESCCQLLSGENLTLALLGNKEEKGYPLEELLWRFYTNAQLGFQTEVSCEFEETEGLKNSSGFSNIKELWNLDPKWFIECIQGILETSTIDNLWIVLPSLLLPWSKVLIDMVDFHWHIEDYSNKDIASISSFWMEHKLIHRETKRITSFANVPWGITEETDLPFDSHPSKEHYLHAVVKVLHRLY